MTRGLITSVVALLLTGGIFLGGEQQALAHADLESSTPAEDEVVAESPDEIEIFFGQELVRQGGLPGVVVVNEAGDVLADEPVVDDADRTRLTVALPPALGDGRYTVIWHTLSDDDAEEARGAFHFYVGEGPSGGPSNGTDDPGATPAPTGTTVVTQPAGGGDGGGNDVPLWALLGGLAVALVVGTSAGVTLASRRAG
ncbi:MAG TPA: copper resistance protein CopC [Dehalococcoidia bacterium]|nr:copper resistance protein CopC [Dehalococcoidia bacterium]